MNDTPPTAFRYGRGFCIFTCKDKPDVTECISLFFVTHPFTDMRALALSGLGEGYRGDLTI